MSDRQKQNPKQATEEQVAWAYAVLESFQQAFDKVASISNQPEKLSMTRELNIEYIENLPKLMEAFMILSQYEHREVVYKYFRSYAGVFDSWQKIQQQNPHK